MTFRKWVNKLNETYMSGYTWDIYNDSLISDTLTRDQILAIQWQKLTAIINHVYENVPFYRRQWKSLGIHPKDIHDFTDFSSKIPIVTKEDVRNNIELFFADKIRPGLYKVNTSGSTGIPGTFYHDSYSRSYAIAMRYRGRNWWNVSPTDNEIRIWGRSTSFSPSLKVRTKDKLKRFKDRLIGVRYLSTFYMHEEKLDYWLNAIRQHNPVVILGYASAIYTFSKYLKNKNINLFDLPLKVITYTSDSFYDHQKDLTRQVFCKNIASEYGSVEIGIIGFEAPCGNIHIMDDAVYLESIEFNDEKNQLVVTNLENFSFPLIRYHTQDTGTVSQKTCSCESPLNIMHLEQGRIFDFFYNAKGELIDPASIDHAVNRPLYTEKGCRRYQVIQQTMDQIDVIIESSFPVSGNAKTAIMKNLNNLIGKNISVNIFQSDHITPEKSGKFKFIISHLH